MHIVFITTEFVTEKFYCGGLSNFTANMARIFSEKGHQVTVLVATHYTKSLIWRKNIHVECMNRFAIPLHEFLPNHNKETSFFQGFMKIAGSLLVRQSLNTINSKRHIDIVHYCNLEALGLFPPKIPFVIRLSSYNNLWKGACQKKFIPDFLQNRHDVTDSLEVLAVKRAMAIISPSFLLADITKQYLGRKAKVIESPYFFCNEWDDTWYRKTLEGKKYILYFGTLSYMKGAHIIADIIYQTLETYQDHYFVLVGSDKKLTDENGSTISANTYIQRAAGKYANRLIYHNTMKKAMLTPVIKNAAVVLLPSRIDNLPNTCIEAMAMKKIVIGTDKASFEQLIRHEYNGFLGERDNPASYQSCINKALSLSEHERTLMEKRAFLRCRHLAPDKIYQYYLSFYKSVIDFWEEHSA